MTVPDVQLTGGVADQVQGVSSLPDAAYSSRDVDTALVPHGFESRMPHMLGVIPSEEAFTGDLVGVVGRPDDGCHIGVEGHELESFMLTGYRRKKNCHTHVSQHDKREREERVNTVVTD